MMQAMLARLITPLIADRLGSSSAVALVGPRQSGKTTLARSLSQTDMKGLDQLADLIGASRRYLISQTLSPAGNELRASCNLEWFLERLIEGSI